MCALNTLQWKRQVCTIVTYDSINATSGPLALPSSNRLFLEDSGRGVQEISSTVGTGLRFSKWLQKGDPDTTGWRKGEQVPGIRNPPLIIDAHHPSCLSDLCTYYSPLCSFDPSHTGLHSVHEYVNFIPTKGPSHLLFPLPWSVLYQILAWLHPSHHLCLRSSYLLKKPALPNFTVPCPRLHHSLPKFHCAIS